MLLESLDHFLVMMQRVIGGDFVRGNDVDVRVWRSGASQQMTRQEMLLLLLKLLLMLTLVV